MNELLQQKSNQIIKLLEILTSVLLNMLLEISTGLLLDVLSHDLKATLKVAPLPCPLSTMHHLPQTSLPSASVSPPTPAVWRQGQGLWWARPG